MTENYIESGADVVRGPWPGIMIQQPQGYAGPQGFQRNAFQDGFQKGGSTYVDPRTVPGLMEGHVTRDHDTVVRG